MTWININIFAYTEAFRDFSLIYILAPLRNLWLSLPWIWVVAAVAIAGGLAGGWRLGAVRGRVDPGDRAGRAVEAGRDQRPRVPDRDHRLLRRRLPARRAGGAQRPGWLILQPLADLLQTMPSFIFLIPFVILFRTGEFTSILIIVSFAIVPVSATPPKVCGRCHATGGGGARARRQSLQRLFQVELPLALPNLVLGLNQTLMMALSMLVITAYVGTNDLGQEAYGAMTRGGDVAIGQGAVAGLAVCALAIAADRIIRAIAHRLGKRLGVAEPAG